jgi:hypothetical protein
MQQLISKAMNTQHLKAAFSDSQLAKKRNMPEPAWEHDSVSRESEKYAHRSCGACNKE